MLFCKSSSDRKKCSKERQLTQRQRKKKSSYLNLRVCTVSICLYVAMDISMLASSYRTTYEMWPPRWLRVTCIVDCTAQVCDKKKRLLFAPHYMSLPADPLLLCVGRISWQSASGCRSCGSWRAPRGPRKNRAMDTFINLLCHSYFIPELQQIINS